jgi:hypothetical protein
LGPDRGLNRAWQHFCAEQGKDHLSARRPGYWAAWSQKYKWVERAEDHDAALEEEKRIAASERRWKLQDMRAQFEVEEQQRIQEQVRDMDSVRKRMETAPLNEVIQVTRDNVAGKKITTKIKAINARDLAVFTETLNKTSSQAIRGVYDIKNIERDERKPQRVVWVPGKKAA